MGVAGVEGNGQTELIEAITGLRRAEAGQVELNGVDITATSVKQRINSGLAHVPEDRQKRGLVLDYTVEDNMVLEIYDREPFSKNGLLNRAGIRSYTQKNHG